MAFSAWEAFLGGTELLHVAYVRYLVKLLFEIFLVSDRDFVKMQKSLLKHGHASNERWDRVLWALAPVLGLLLILTGHEIKDGFGHRGLACPMRDILVLIDNQALARFHLHQFPISKNT